MYFGHIFATAERRERQCVLPFTARSLVFSVHDRPTLLFCVTRQCQLRHSFTGLLVALANSSSPPMEVGNLTALTSELA